MQTYHAFTCFTVRVSKVSLFVNDVNIGSKLFVFLVAGANKTLLTRTVNQTTFTSFLQTIRLLNRRLLDSGLID